MVNHSRIYSRRREGQALAFLSPAVMKSIITGRQPAWLDSGALCNKDSISHDWDEQKHNFLPGRAS